MQRGLPTRSAARQRAWLDTEPPHPRAPRRQVDTTRLPQALVISRTLATSGAGRPATLMLLRGAPRACITMAAAGGGPPGAAEPAERPHVLETIEARLDLAFATAAAVGQQRENLPLPARGPIDRFAGPWPPRDDRVHGAASRSRASRARWCSTCARRRREDAIGRSSA